MMFKKISILISFTLILISNVTLFASETIKFDRFGYVTIYRNKPIPSEVVLFVSGDGGWNQGVVDMAISLSKLDALVAGIDIRRYLQGLSTSKQECNYPAADFEALSKFIQKTYDFPKYVSPTLVGYSSGATLVYATLVQAPVNTFKGAVSLGFCPDLPLTKPLCKGSGLQWEAGPKGKGYSFLPTQNLKNTWIAFQGTIDQVCNAKDVEAYVKQVTNGELILLPNVGHGFSVQKNWLPQFKDAFKELVEKNKEQEFSLNDDLKDLPLIEVNTSDSTSDTFAVMLSGDGGWAGLDKEVADALMNKKIPVVGISSLQYFWNPRTPDGTSKDLARIINHYIEAWKKNKIILIGYSLGADVLPFMIARLPKDLIQSIKLAVLIGPSHSVDFEFHITDWIKSADSAKYSVLPEIKKIKDVKILGLYGKDETDTVCKELDQSNVKTIPLIGGHHFGGNYGSIANIILDEAK
jgi:type IV secretory pathway VirJ component